MRIRIDSPKSGLRCCPIFPDVKPLLDMAWDDDDRGELCVKDYRGSDNVSTLLLKIIAKAGLPRWPKLNINLRSTRRTEL